LRIELAFLGDFGDTIGDTVFVLGLAALGGVNNFGGGFTGFGGVVFNIINGAGCSGGDLN
jgi:hypothetical protein